MKINKGKPYFKWSQEALNGSSHEHTICHSLLYTLGQEEVYYHIRKKIFSSPSNNSANEKPPLPELSCSGLLFKTTPPMGTSLAVQWLRLHTCTAGGTGSIPGQGTKIPTCHVVCPKK